MGIFSKINAVFRKKDTQEIIDNLEEVLLEAGLSPKLAYETMDKLDKKAGVKADTQKAVDILKGLLMEYAKEYKFHLPREQHVFMFIGVNGVGKTTSIAKFVHYLMSVHKVSSDDIVIAAGDTFRAGAIEQIEKHGKKLGVKVVKQSAGSDPAAVVYDTLSYAKSKNVPYIIADTAGRMNNRKDLIAQLQKIYRLLGRDLTEEHISTFIVLDGNSGLNTMTQVEDFKEAVDIDAIILSKYDGSSKGGSLLSIAQKYGTPCAFLGVGEQYPDFKSFDSEVFLDDFLLH